MKKILIYSFAGILTFACSQEPKGSDSDEVVSKVASEELSDEELQKELKELEEKERQAQIAEENSTTTLVFDKLRHDYGNVRPDSENLCKFKVTNTGKNPLIIEKVSASCGCTTPHKPEKPIAPGESDFIEVGFHPKPGQVNEIIKTVTVVANTKPKESEISIRAFVK